MIFFLLKKNSGHQSGRDNWHAGYAWWRISLSNNSPIFSMNRIGKWKGKMEDDGWQFGVFCLCDCQCLYLFCLDVVDVADGVDLLIFYWTKGREMKQDDSLYQLTHFRFMPLSLIRPRIDTLGSDTQTRLPTIVSSLLGLLDWFDFHLFLFSLTPSFFNSISFPWAHVRTFLVGTVHFSLLLNS